MVVRRRASVALALLLSIAALVFAGVPTGHAAPAQAGHAQLTIGRITPTVASPGKAITVAGTVHNPTGHWITPTITVQLSPQLLDTVRRLDDWMQGRLPAGGTTVATQALAAIPPGEDGNFAARISAKALHYPYHLASLPMTVTAAGPDMSMQTVRSTLQWSTQAARNPLDTTIVVPLTLPADPALFGPAGADRDAAWQRAIGPGSRIDRLLTAMAGLPVTWIVDPAMLNPPAAADHNLPPAAGPSPTPSSGATQPPSSTPGDTATGTAPTGAPSGAPSHANPPATAPPDLPTRSGQAPLPTPPASSETKGKTATDVVADLTARLTQRLQHTSGTIWWTPYGDPDLAALSAGTPGRALLTRELRRSLPDQLASLSKTSVAWPAGATGAKTTGRIATAWTKATGRQPLMVLPRRSVSAAPTSPQGARTVAGTGGVITYDQQLSALLADSGQAPALNAQQFLAQTLAIYQQQPGAERSITVVLPRDATTDPHALSQQVHRILSASWLTARTGQAAVRRVSTAVKATVVDTPDIKGYPRTPASPLTSAMLHQVRGDRHTLRGLGSVLADSDDVITDRMQGLDVVGSTRWRAHAPQLQKVAAADAAAVRSLRGKVSVRPSTVNFFTSSGKLTVTVVNHLNRPVKDLELSLIPRKYLLRIQDPVQTVALGATARAAVRFDVKAVGSGQVQVDAVLRTPGGLVLGDEPGEVTQLEVNVRPTSSWIYWVLGIVAGIVLVIGLVRSIRRGPRELTTPGPHDEPMPTDPSAGGTQDQQDDG